MVEFQISAMSVTTSVKEWLVQSRLPRVLHVFEEACNLINENGEVIAIVTPGIGMGPFHLVLEEPVCISKAIAADSRIHRTADRLMVGDLIVSTGDANIWEPRPPWEQLQEYLENIVSQLLRLPIMDPPFPSQLGTSLACLDQDRSLQEAARLAGLGSGLTPAGDDFILGALYAAWMIHPVTSIRGLAWEIAALSAARTTSLSAAYLRAAGNGEAGILWHNFFNALLSGAPDRVHISFDEILSVGATSGADAMAGFFSTFISWMEYHTIACQS